MDDYCISFLPHEKDQSVCYISRKNVVVILYSFYLNKIKSLINIIYLFWEEMIPFKFMKSYTCIHYFIFRKANLVTYDGFRAWSICTVLIIGHVYSR